MEVSLLRVEGLRRLLGLGWCSGDLTMADMRIWCRAWAGVEEAVCSCALKWAAALEKDKSVLNTLLQCVTLEHFLLLK